MRSAEHEDNPAPSEPAESNAGPADTDGLALQLLSEIRDEIYAVRLKTESTAARTEELVDEVTVLRDRLDLVPTHRQMRGLVDPAQARLAPRRVATLVGVALLCVSWALALQLRGAFVPWGLLALLLANALGAAAVWYGWRPGQARRLT